MYNRKYREGGKGMYSNGRVIFPTLSDPCPTDDHGDAIDRDGERERHGAAPASDEMNTVLRCTVLFSSLF